MSSAPHSPPDRRSAAERALLAALCQGSLPAPAREEVLRRLARHGFSVPEHEVIFQAASKLPARREADASKTGSELLMASLTRLGFPDIDLAPFFDMRPPDEVDLPALLNDL